MLYKLAMMQNTIENGTGYKKSPVNINKNNNNMEKRNYRGQIPFNLTDFWFCEGFFFAWLASLFVYTHSFEANVPLIL